MKLQRIKMGWLGLGRVWTREVFEDIAWSRTEVKDGYPIPPYYSFCYYDFNTDAWIYYPIGLNWLILLARGLRRFFKFHVAEFLGKTERYEVMLFKAGIREGRARLIVELRSHGVDIDLDGKVYKGSGPQV